MVRHLPSNPGIGHDRSAISHCLYVLQSVFHSDTFLRKCIYPRICCCKLQGCKRARPPSRSAALLSD